MKPRGFRASLVRAIDAVELALEALGRPVCVREETVRHLHVAAVTAGASAPESALQAVIRHPQEPGFTRVREVGTIAEKVQFPVPQELRAAPILTQIAALP